MRKPPARVVPFSLCIALFSCLLPTLSAQQKAPGASPADPKALMLAASKTNNLTNADARPWHIQASFQLLDTQGNVTDEGTYEEFWASQKKFKRTFTSKSFSLTDYGTDKGLRRAAAHGDAPFLLLEGYHELTSPLPDETIISRETYTAKPIAMGSMSLTCVVSTSPFSPSECIDNAEPMLRVTVYSADSYEGLPLQVVRNRMLRFHEHTVAGDLKFVRDGKTVLTMHLDNLETLPALDEALFTPPSDTVPALPYIRRISVSAGVSASMRLTHPEPQYPAVARAAHVSGTVVLAALIGTDGHVQNLQVIDGPPMLRQASLDAVKTWTYRPFLLNGNPVAVQTTINVVFEIHP